MSLLSICKDTELHLFSKNNQRLCFNEDMNYTSKCKKTAIYAFIA